MTTEITIPASKFAAASSLPSTFASQPSFTQKLLNFAITLDASAQTPQPTSFADMSGSASGTYTITGARARVRISHALALAGSTADVSIFGLSQSLMNQLATLGVIVNSVSKSQILVSAGASSLDDASSAAASGSPLAGFPVVFGGTIYFAYGDYKNMPNVPLHITANGGLINNVASVAPASFSGSSDIVSIMQSFADKLGVPLENNDVNATLANGYFPGTLLPAGLPGRRARQHPRADRRRRHEAGHLAGTGRFADVSGEHPAHIAGHRNDRVPQLRSERMDVDRDALQPRRHPRGQHPGRKLHPTGQQDLDDVPAQLSFGHART